MYRIGIDLGGTNIAVGIVDETQTIVAAASMPTVAKNGADALLDDMRPAGAFKRRAGPGGLLRRGHRRARHLRHAARDRPLRP